MLLLTAFLLQDYRHRFTSFFPERSNRVIHEDSKIFAQALEHPGIFLTEDLMNNPDADALRNLMSRRGAKLYCAIQVNDKVTAIILIGFHKNSVNFTQADQVKMAAIAKKIIKELPLLLTMAAHVGSRTI